MNIGEIIVELIKIVKQLFYPIKELIPILTIIIGGFIAFYFDRKKNREFVLNEQKRKVYGEFISIIIDVFGQSKYSAKKQKIVGDPVEKLYDFYKGFILYASPKAINAYADYMQFLFKYVGVEVEGENEDGKEISNDRTKEQLYLLTRLFGIMREEVGLKNNKLGDHNSHLFRPILTDFDIILYC